MKLSSNTIAKFARDVFTKKKTLAANRLIHPHRDWAIGLFLGGCILVGIMAWSAYMYVSNRSGDNAQEKVDPASLPVYRAATIEQAIELFQKKETAYNSLKQQVIVPPVIIEETTEEVSTDSNTSSTDVLPATATSTPVTTTDQLSDTADVEVEDESIQEEGRESLGTPVPSE